MKLLIVTPLYVPTVGGAELHLREISRRLAARGHEVSVLTTDVRNPWERQSAGLLKQEVLEGVYIRRQPPEGSFNRALFDAWQRLPGGYRSGQWIFGAEGLEMLTRIPRPAGLIRAILASHADVLISFNWYWPSAYYVYLARKLKRFRLVGIPLFHLAEPWCYGDLYRRMLAQCDAVVANTEFEAQFIEQQAGVRAIAGGVGFQSELFEKRNGREIRDRYGIGNDEVIGFVGRQLHNKGIATLIRAMCKVWPVQPNARLLIAGPRPPADRELEYLMSSLTDFERQHIIVVNGFSDEEKSSIYDAMDIFVLPSTGESFGIAYLEAWMCDKPVIGARIGPTQCVIQDGIDGLLVTPQDDEDTARAILELLADPYRRTVMGRIGHSKTVEQFTWERVTDRVEALLGNVVGERTAPGIAAAECVGSSKCGKH